MRRVPWWGGGEGARSDGFRPEAVPEVVLDPGQSALRCTLLGSGLGVEEVELALGLGCVQP